MPTITTVDATWDTSVTMDASELRRADTTMFLGDGTANGIRGGIAYHGSTSLAVSVNGSDQVTVQAGAAVIPAATGLGVYRCSLGAATSAVALSARNATNPRIDLVVIQVTGTNATVKTIDGTPAGSPSPPALPAQHIELARLTVPQTGGGAVTVDSTWRTFATALGGQILVPTAARLPGSGNITGQTGLALDTGIEHRWDGTVWRPTLGAWTAYTPTWTAPTNPSLGNGSLTGSYTMTRGLVVGRFKLTIGTTTTLGSGAWAIGVPFPPASDYAEVAVGAAKATDLGVNNYGRTLYFGTTTMFGVGPAGEFITNSAPFGWNSGDIYAGTFSYEPA